jgi:hypothetical protein
MSLRRALRRFRPWLIGLGVCLSVALWLAFQHKPGWYQPVEANEEVLRRVRRDAPNLADRISDHLVRGIPIDIVLDQATVNEWLAALPHVWPDAGRRFPEDISNPAVSFEPGRVRLGAHLKRSGWRVIGAITVELALDPVGDSVIVRLSGVQGGSLSVPRSLLAGWVTRQLARLNPDIVEMQKTPVAAQRQGEAVAQTVPDVVDRLRAARRSSSSGKDSDEWNDVWRRVKSADELYEGVRFPNRFTWPNGRRAFRVASLTMTRGELRIRLEPL